MSKKQSVILAMLLVSVGFASRPAAAASCDSLATLALPHATITLANAVDAGSFVPFPALRGAGGAPPAAGAPGRGRGAVPSPFGDLPAFCRVTATLMPSADSEIKIELW